MFDQTRQWLRQRLWWVQFQELRREGFRAAWTRRTIQRKILSTKPIATAKTGDLEVRVLTWRRDWINMIWALKSYYYYSQADYPLHIHDGGLLSWQIDELLRHFPNANIIHREEADRLIPKLLEDQQLIRSATYRSKNISTRKIFDFVLFSQSEWFVTIDSDIVFFKNPQLLNRSQSTFQKNLYNLDDGYWYSCSLDELESALHVRPFSGINSGLALIRRESLDLRRIEDFLAYPPLFKNDWVTEQTLHALCSTIYGVELLPETYRVGGPPGITPDLVCKHYPGTHRPLLYTEGMQYLIENGFLDQLGKS